MNVSFLDVRSELKTVFLLSFPARSFGCVLFCQFGWLHTWDHRHTVEEVVKGKSYLHPVKLFLMVSQFHQMAFLNRLQSGTADHRTSHTEAKPAFTNPPKSHRERTNFKLHFQNRLTSSLTSAAQSAWARSWTVTFSSNDTEIQTKSKLWSGGVQQKIITDPE